MMDQVNVLMGALGIKGIILMLLGIFIVVFILKKLIKLAVMIAIIAFLIYYGMPLIQSAASGIH